MKTADHEPGTMEYVDRRQVQLGPYLERQQRKVSHRQCYMRRSTAFIF